MLEKNRSVKKAASDASKVIRITCEGAAMIPLSDLRHFQGHLKTLREPQYVKLRNAIEGKYGFCDPVRVWRHGGKCHILDGHQRVFVVEKMIADGWSLPKNSLPVVWVDAKDEKTAKEIVLLLTSQYGEYDMESVALFIQEADIAFPSLKETLAFPGFSMDDLAKGWFEDYVPPDEGSTKAVSFEAGETVCPKCGHSW